VEIFFFFVFLLLLHLYGDSGMIFSLNYFIIYVDDVKVYMKNINEDHGSYVLL